MNADARRQAIWSLLQTAPQPVSAGSLAARFSVSRQVIVGDVALLRASGADISATPRGYIVRPSAAGVLRQIACRHDAAHMERELQIIVDQGCTVVDVTVEHPVYGQLTGSLQLSSRYDVSQFLARCSASDAQPLSNLTDGIHLHTIACPDEAACRRVQRQLDEAGFLLRG